MGSVIDKPLSICQRFSTEVSVGPSRKCTQLLQPYLGRIEIMGGAKEIELVYFEISESSRTQEAQVEGV